MSAHKAPPSLGFSRQEHWSGLPFPSPMQESEKWEWSRSVVSDSYWPHGLQPTRLLHPWDFLGKSTRVGCHCLLQITLTYYIIIVYNTYYIILYLLILLLLFNKNGVDTLMSLRTFRELSPVYWLPSKQILPLGKKWYFSQNVSVPFFFFFFHSYYIFIK